MKPKLTLTKTKLTFFLLLSILFWSCGSDETITNPGSSVDDISTHTLKTEPQNVVAASSLADSLFEELMSTVNDTMDLNNINSENTTINKLAELNSGFKKAAEQDTTNIKANLGFITTRFAALNYDKDMQELADSISSYINTENSNEIAISNKNNKDLFKLSKELTYQTPILAKKLETESSFPAFITINKIQTLSENSVIPALNDIEIAIKRLESNPKSLKVTIGETTKEIDLGEIYLLHSSINALKAVLYTFCMRDFDLFSPNGDGTYSWINDAYNTDNYIETKTYDSTYDDYAYNEIETDSQDSIIASVIQYNLSRDGFLTIRKNYGKSAYNNIKATIDNTKNAINSIKAETDDQTDDILTIDMISDLDSSLADMKKELSNENTDPKIVKAFSSSNDLLSFMDDFISGPYTIKIDDKNSITVNVSKFFLDPVVDGKTLLPKMKWLPKSEWIKKYTDEYGNSNADFNPVILVDEQGKEISEDDVPYFADYTFGGIFPNMTREKLKTLYNM